MTQRGGVPDVASEGVVSEILPMGRWGISLRVVEFMVGGWVGRWVDYEVRSPGYQGYYEERKGVTAYGSPESRG
eukprot:747225-Hanusia_phi.AAC.1